MKFRTILLVSILFGFFFSSRADFILINNDPMMPVGVWGVWKEKARVILLKKNIESGGGMALVNFAKNKPDYIWIVQNFGLSGGSIFKLTKNLDCFFIYQSSDCFMDCYLESASFGAIIKFENSSFCSSQDSLLNKNISALAKRVRDSFATEGLEFEIPCSPVGNSCYNADINDGKYKFPFTSKTSLSLLSLFTKGGFIVGKDYSNKDISGYFLSNGLSPEIPSNSYFVKCNFNNANFNGIDLRNSIFIDCSFKEALFKEVSLDYSSFSSSTNSGQPISFVGADFTSSSFVGTVIRNSDLSNANFKNCVLNKTTINNSKLKGNVFEGSQLLNMKLKGNFDSSSLIGANITNVNFAGSSFKEANLSKSVIKKSKFNGLNLEKANLSGAVIKNTTFSGCYLLKANLNDSDLRGINFVKSNLTNANLKKALLQKADLTGAKISGASWNGANLTGTKMNRTDKAEIVYGGSKSDKNQIAIDTDKREAMNLWGIILRERQQAFESLENFGRNPSPNISGYGYNSGYGNNPYSRDLHIDY
ncbi:pentapeptide repeat-containing protein [bacterium]|jgi:uncharacterized protein YjbI with pentapeptide repeats|nr:pentapeptide repeat-containing protein [bacterium]